VNTENAESNGQLTPRQQALIASLLCHGELKKAAQAVNVPYRSAKRWAQLPHFKAALTQARDEGLAGAHRLLSDCAVKAADVLRSLLHSESERTRLRAAVEVLKRLEAAGLAEVQQKLQDLEDAVQGKPPAPRPWQAD
jgi:hypothetical protein